MPVDAKVVTLMQERRNRCGLRCCGPARPSTSTTLRERLVSTRSAQLGSVLYWVGDEA